MSSLFYISDEPSPADLAAIEAEWPQIQADIDALADPDAVDILVDAIYALERSSLIELNHRRQRRIKARIAREVEMAARPGISKAVA